MANISSINDRIAQQITEPESVSLEDAIVVARVKLLASQRSSIWVGNLSVATFTTWIYWDENPLPALLWCIIHYALAFARYAGFFRYLKNADKSVLQQARLLKSMCGFTFLAGLNWGCAAFLFLNPSEPTMLTLLVIIIIGVATGGLPGLTMYFPAYVTFVIPIVVCLSLSLALEGSDQLLLLAAMSTAFGCVVLAFGRNLANATTTSITMEQKMAKLYMEVSQAKERVEQISEGKSRFLAAISHDVSQPLYSMMLYMQTLRNKITTDDQSQLLDKLENSSEALHEMFNSMLDVARLEQGDVDKHETDFPLARIISNLEDESRLLAEQKKLTFSVDVSEDIVVHSDSVLMARILRNLIGNAVKYTDQGFVHITAEQQGDQVLIQVSDSGLGIAIAEQETIFQEYRQINNPQRDYAKGLGLGLSVVNKLVLLLGHDLTLQSELGKGSTFTLKVTQGFLHGGHTPLEQRLTSDRDLAGLHILVLEDDTAVREGLTALLDSWGCSVSAAENIETLIECAQQKSRPADLLLCDYRLPGIYDGVTATAEIRKRIDPQLPSIIVSGDGHEKVVKHVRLNSLGFLSKPVLPDKLREKIAQSV